MSASKSLQGVTLRDENGALVGVPAIPLRTDPTGTTAQPITAASLPLPAGAATEATLAARATEATLSALNTVLTAIRDTAGIKKILDAVDVSDRVARALGRVRLRNPGDSADMGDATTPVRVDPTGTTPQPVRGADMFAQGTITAVNGAVTVTCAGCGNAVLQVTGTWVGTLVFEGTVDGTNWFQVRGYFIGDVAAGTLSISANNSLRLVVGGFVSARVRASAFTSGTATVSLNAGAGSSGSRGAITQTVFASTANSSTATLGVSGVFTGAAESTLDVAGIQVNAFSNVASATNGLRVEQSMNGTNWDLVDAYTLAAGVGIGITVQATASFFRIVFTNGAVAQTSFRLQVALCPMVEAVPRSLGQKASQLSMSVVLASDQPANTIVFVKQVEEPTFVVTSNAVTTGNNKSMISIVNENTGSPPDAIKILCVSLVNVQTGVVTGVFADFEFRRISGATGGTVITSETYDTANTLPSNVVARTGGTVSGEGGILTAVRWSTDEVVAGTADMESADSVGQYGIPVFERNDRAQKALILRPGQGAHIKCATNTTTGSFRASITFSIPF